MCESRRDHVSLYIHRITPYTDRQDKKAIMCNSCDFLLAFYLYIIGPLNLCINSTHALVSSSPHSSLVPAPHLPLLSYSCPLVFCSFTSFSPHFHSSTTPTHPLTLYLHLKTPCVCPVEKCTYCMDDM